MAEPRNSVVVQERKDVILHRMLRTLAQWVIAICFVLFLLFGSNWIT